MTIDVTSAEDLAFSSALDLAALVRARSLSPLELLNLYLDRIQRIDPSLNAYVTVDSEGARALARAQESLLASGSPLGPFVGVPLPIKDLNPVAGIRTTFSHKGFSDYVPTLDPSMIRRLRQAGFILLGKTNAPEFGLVGTTESELNGTCINPWNRDVSAGGSSGGAAAAVAAGLAPAAHGGDGGGSVRVPASLCGVFGLKPSRGRISRGPAVGDALHGFATDGPLTRTVTDAAALLDVMAGYETGDPYWAPPPAGTFAEAATTRPRRLHIGVTLTGLWPAAVDAETEQAVDGARIALEESGHRVTDVAPNWPNPDLQADLRIFYSSVFHYQMATDRMLMEPHNRLFAEYAAGVSARDHIRALVRIQAHARTVVAAWDEFDVLLSPVIPTSRPPHGWLLADVDPWAVGSRQFEFIAFSVLANMTGQPAVSVPLHWATDGQPVGVQLTGRPADDATLLQLSAQLEAARPWALRRPSID